jgi:AAA15 family ATPase/GTPase
LFFRVFDTTINYIANKVVIWDSGNMAKETAEILEIHDFLSIKDVKWEFERFNIITGDMGAGKSLCIKLVKFFEDIIPNLLVSPYESFLKFLNPEQFFTYLTEEFTKIFVFSAWDTARQPQFSINYTFSYKEEKFNIIIKGKNEKDINIESPYL